MVNIENQPKSCIIVTKNHQVARFQHQKWQIGKERAMENIPRIMRGVSRSSASPISSDEKVQQTRSLSLSLSSLSTKALGLLFQCIFQTHHGEKCILWYHITPASAVRKGTLWWFEEDLLYGAWWELNWLSWKKDVRWTVIMAQALGIPAWIFDQNHPD